MTIAKNQILPIASLHEMTCPDCSSPLSLSTNFCANCGKRLRTIALSTSIAKQIIVYLVSFFLAPLGLWYAWKYLRQEDNKSKAIGGVAIALTVLSIALTIWTVAGLFNSAGPLLKSLIGLGL
jgi:hypothetical protein